SIAVVLSLSSGFQKQIDDTQSETLAQFPITISQITADQDPELYENRDLKGTFPDTKEVTAKINEADPAQHTNKIDEDYITYLEDIDSELSNNIGYTRLASMNLFREINGEPTDDHLSNNTAEGSETGSMMTMMANQTVVGVSSFPQQLDDSKGNYLKDNYRLLEGEFPQDINDVVLVIDNNNATNINALTNLGFEVEDGDKLPFSDIVGTKIKLAYNDAYYTELPTGNFIPNQDLAEVYDNSENEELTITGIIRIKNSSTMDLLAPG